MHVSFRRARRFSSRIEQEIYLFIAAKQADRYPRRKDKPCGRDRFGKVVCPEQLRLATGTIT